MKNKKGVSGVITAVILIGLAIVSAGVVWGVVNNLLSEQLDEAESCFGVFDKVSLNNQFTCLNTSGELEEDDFMIFQLNLADIEPSSVVVSIVTSGETKSYTIEKDSDTSGLDTWPIGDQSTALPGKNGGKTYRTTEPLSGTPTLIQVIPVVGGNQCQVSDKIETIDNCFLLAS